MSVQELFDFQESLRDWVENPRAWLLQANPVWASSETVNRIALFDTKEAVLAYIEASRLPKVADPKDNTTRDGYHRTFRPDSLLWDYNADEFHAPLMTPAIPWTLYVGVAQNPLPPTGAAPPLNNFDSAHLPRYGQDFDQGHGGPYTNADGAVPESGRPA